MAVTGCQRGGFLFNHGPFSQAERSLSEFAGTAKFKLQRYCESGLSYWEQFVMAVACSFLAALILCCFDSFRWRKFKLVERFEDDSPDQPGTNDQMRWWHVIFALVFGVPLAIILFPFLLGAVPALFLATMLARFLWLRRVVRRRLYRSGVAFSWPLSFAITPFVLINRAARHWFSRRSLPETQQAG